MSRVGTFYGGITNSGTIVTADGKHPAGIGVFGGGTFYGGIVNSAGGYISAAGGIVVTKWRQFGTTSSGGITNSGTIAAGRYRNCLSSAS